ncbi:MAG: DUF1917 domain-containing protein [Chloroflexi bacterium]|nr:DUF1917 domain-containing protein [Chloroflexota bacterium]
MSDDSQGMPDLDLIARVQQARMQQDAEVTPSQVSAVYWIETARRTAGPPPTPRAGYFSIPTTVDQVDALWQRIREATETGSLGYKARVSTASRELGKNPRDREIRVVTADADDEADVARVREALRTMGLTPLEYIRGG